jgi:hypothetical protein
LGLRRKKDKKKERKERKQERREKRRKKRGEPNPNSKRNMKITNKTKIKNDVFCFCFIPHERFSPHLGMMKN